MVWCDLLQANPPQHLIPHFHGDDAIGEDVLDILLLLISKRTGVKVLKSSLLQPIGRPTSVEDSQPEKYLGP